MLGGKAIGARIEVWWPMDETWFACAPSSLHSGMPAMPACARRVADGLCCKWGAWASVVGMSCALEAQRCFQDLPASVSWDGFCKLEEAGCILVFMRKCWDGA